VWSKTRQAIDAIVGGKQALAVASRYAEGLQSMDYILVMHAGNFIEGGSRERVFSNPAHPVTRHLLEGKNNRLSLSDAEAIEGVSDAPKKHAVSLEPGHWVVASHLEMEPV
jgi:ABC-type dipeptide/oligopeptide/nickel transport system ATPase component